VRREWRRYTQTAPFWDRNVREGPRAVREVLARIAGWRLARRAYALPVEQKLFDWYVRLGGRRRE
jgi:hypothetical protein